MLANNPRSLDASFYSSTFFNILPVCHGNHLGDAGRGKKNCVYRIALCIVLGFGLGKYHLRFLMR